MKIQKIPNSQQSSERTEPEESEFLASDYTTKLQKSKQQGNGTKTDIQINGTEQRTKKETHSILIIYSKTRETEFILGKTQSPQQELLEKLDIIM